MESQEVNAQLEGGVNFIGGVGWINHFKVALVEQIVSKPKNVVQSKVQKKMKNGHNQKTHSVRHEECSPRAAHITSIVLDYTFVTNLFLVSYNFIVTLWNLFLTFTKNNQWY